MSIPRYLCAYILLARGIFQVALLNERNDIIADKIRCLTYLLRRTFLLLLLLRWLPPPQLPLLCADAACGLLHRRSF